MLLYIASDFSGWKVKTIFVFLELISIGKHNEGW